MFSLSSIPIDDTQLKTAAEDPTCGALVTFEGWVRDHNEGQAVTALEYEAYESLALLEGNQILTEAIEKFALKNARCVHRTGKLAIGEMAVWVGVATPHREAAFQACRYIIDEVKTRVPIWKKETYENGDSGWVNCEACAKHGQPLPMDYSRQTILPQVGPLGQRKLAASRVLVIGAGGLGSVVLPYLAAAGIGQLGIVEHDQLDASNLHRQLIYTPDQVGQSKAALATESIKKLNPTVRIESFPDRFQTLEISALLENYDLIVECTDCMETKLVVNRAAINANLPVVFASIYQFEGQLQVYSPTADSSCLQCLWEKGAAPAVPSCSAAGVLGPVAGVLGSMQALEVIKQLLDLDGVLKNELLLINLLDYGIRRITLPRNPKCTAHNPENPMPESIGITPKELSQLGSFNWIDIREPHEVAENPLPVDHRHIPMNQLMEQPQLIDPTKPAVLVCAAGIRTNFAAKALRDIGYTQVYSLIGGNRQVPTD